MIQTDAQELTNPTDFGSPAISSTGSVTDDGGASIGSWQWQWQWAGQHWPSDPCIRFSEARQLLSTISVDGCAAGERLDGSDSELSIQVWNWNSETEELDFVGEKNANDLHAAEVPANAKRHATPAMTDNNRLIWLRGNIFDFESCGNTQCAAVRKQCCSMCEIHRLCRHCSSAVRFAIGYFTIVHQDEGAIDDSNTAERASIANLRRVDIRMCPSCFEKTNSGTRTR